MKIVLAGQLDRVYSNALARTLEEAYDARPEDVDPAQVERDRFLFRRAGTLAALSSGVVLAPDWYPDDDEDECSYAAPHINDPIFAPGMSLTQQMWRELYDDAVGLVKVVDFFGSYSKSTLTTFEEIDGPNAWVEDVSPRSLQRATAGAVHAYLTELLLQCVLAWQTGSIFVIAQADCHILADVATYLIDGARPRPFPIPDFRDFSTLAPTFVTGRIINLELGDLADIEIKRQNSAVQDYARQLHAIFHAADVRDADVRFEKARLSSHFNECGGCIEIVIGDMGIIGNSGVKVPMKNRDQIRFSRRNFGQHRLRTLVLA